MSQPTKIVLAAIVLWIIFRILIAVAGIKIGALESGLLGAVAAVLAQWLMKPETE
jgi:hypothetical protein